MTLIIKINSVAVIFTILVKTCPCTAECNLAKIFRTPRDFDHLEIVERAGFDRTESTTTPPSTERPTSKSSKKNGNNHASAHVSLRFGTDYGSHIMKIPPQCRHLVGNSMNHLPDALSNSNFFYPPPPPYRTPPACPSHQFYHPYPPPVPYVFPNYYFWSPREESTHLPPQLNEYFRRHPDFVVGRYPYQEEIFVGGRPVRREEVNVMIPTDFVDSNLTPMKISEDLNVHPNNLPMSLKPIQLIRSRILSPLNPTKEGVDKSNQENKEIKRDCTIQQKDNDDVDIGNNISMEFSNSIEEIPDQNKTNKSTELDDLELNTQDVQKQIDYPSEPRIPESMIKDVEKEMDDLISELKASEQGLQDVPKNWDDISEPDPQEPTTKEFNNDLNKSLVEYKCKNCTDPSKMLISYPVFNRNDKLLPEEVIQTSSGPNCAISRQDKFANDIDSLKLLKTKDIVDNVNDDSYKPNSTTNLPTRKNFTNDIDDLVSVMIEIIDTGNSSTSTLIPKLIFPDYSSLSSGIISPSAKHFLSDDPLLYPDVISPFSPLLPKVTPPPVSSILNLLLGYYGSLVSQGTYAALNQYKDNIPNTQTIQLGYLSPFGSDSKSMLAYDSPPQVKLLDFDQRIPSTEPDIDYRRYALPETILPTKKECISKESSLPTYLKVKPIMEEVKIATIGTLPNLESRLNIENLQDVYMPSINPISKATIEPTLQSTNSFFSKPSGLIKEENNIPKYFQIIPRGDLQHELPTEDDIFPTIIPYSNIPDESDDVLLQPTRDPESNYCRKCGHKHSGGNYCDKCGYPLIFYPSPMDPYCQSCTKETKQLNDW